MFFEFRFWKYLFNRNDLIVSLKEDATMRGFQSRVWFVAIFGILLFALRDIWGLHTEELTALFVNSYEDTFTIARIISLIGTIFWSLLYMGFHFFVIAFILHKITQVELSKVAILQLFVVAFLLMEKAFNYFLYAVVGYATDYSVLSFGPLAATFIEQSYVNYFFNELSLITGLIIAIQFHFLRAFTAMSTRNLFLLLLGIQVILAIITAGFEVLPIELWIEGGQTK
ncbi:hypothetical protein [Psychrobacillus psychrodurans]|uniref:hypothetical protein n=1 Tax=Psychrobacillus psychrodurans TaxID=126157 RepID=UPI0008EB7967|nr:hypothetical protein [Psychrobacillus psychrodurans]MCZ8539012.1 hypothetical protein [Psychrobacillus psychrodurans]SFM26854.1 hypothetical protein SAMN05421832_101370 [Psychrobacillus psychrodurans]